MRPIHLVLLLALCAVPATGMSKSPGARHGGQIVTIEIAVNEASPAMTWATVVDRKGRRCGGTLEHPLREIPGCIREMQWEQGTPEPASMGTSTNAKAKQNDDSPTGIGFTIRDSTSKFGLVREGGCLLQLASEGDGLVQLSLVAEGPDLALGKDTTSVMVPKGALARLRLDWRIEGSRCVVKIFRPQPDAPRSR